MTALAPPVSPAQGIAVAATPVVLGTTSTIPLPADVKAGSQPWRTPWVVLLNSSPFTIVVATNGATVTQIAAFTSDKVFVLATGINSLTITPVAGAGTVTTLEDSTCYATWYADEPPGNYPAAVGSGAVILQTATTFIPSQVGTVLANLGSTTFGGATGTAVGATLGLALTVLCTAGNSLLITVSWFDSAGTFVIAQRKIVLGDGAFTAGSQVQVQMPHFGSRVQVVVSNNSGANITYNISAVFLQVARDGFVVQTITGSPDIGGSQLMSFGGSFGVGGTGVICPMGRNIYAGPAQLSIDAGGCANWTDIMETRDNTGTWNPYAKWTSGQAGLSNYGFTIPILVPAAQFRHRFINNDVANRSVQVVMYADDWRNP